MSNVLKKSLAEAVTFNVVYQVADLFPFLIDDGFYDKVTRIVWPMSKEFVEDLAGFDIKVIDTIDAKKDFCARAIKAVKVALEL